MVIEEDMSKANTFKNNTKAAIRKRKAAQFVAKLHQRPTDEILAMIAIMKVQLEKIEMDSKEKGQKLKELDTAEAAAQLQRMEKTAVSSIQSIKQSILYMSQIIRARPIVEKDSEA